jgi:hypothetical protein
VNRTLGQNLGAAAALLLGALVLLGCGRGGSLTGSSVDVGAELDRVEADRKKKPAPPVGPIWRGAVVVSGTPAVLTLLEKAWQRTPKDWEPRGWTINVFAGPIPAPADCYLGDPPRPCPPTIHGYTNASRRLIGLSLEQGPARFVQIATWELGNARRAAALGDYRDMGQ